MKAFASSIQRLYVAVIVLGLIGLDCTLPAQAQVIVDVNVDGAGVDSMYEARIEAAWDEVRPYRRQADERAAAKAAALQATYAEEFFRYFLENPATSTGRHAAEAAFTMWANIGALQKLEEAGARVGPDAAVWISFILNVERVYEEQGRSDDFVTLLQRLETRLTHADSRAMALLRLGKYAVEEDDLKEAAAHFERILTLDADSFYVTSAREMIYEIKTLGIGRQAPDFTAESINGRPITLSGLRGKVVLLDFWATWCGPCHAEMPLLKDLAAAYAGDVVIVGISMDAERADVEAYVQTKGLTWPQILQPERWDGALPALYNVSAIPRAYIIDREGRIAHKNLRGEEMVQAVEALVRKGR